MTSRSKEALVGSRLAALFPHSRLVLLVSAADPSAGIDRDALVLYLLMAALILVPAAILIRQLIRARAYQFRSWSAVTVPYTWCDIVDEADGTRYAVVRRPHGSTHKATHHVQETIAIECADPPCYFYVDKKGVYNGRSFLFEPASVRKAFRIDGVTFPVWRSEEPERLQRLQDDAAFSALVDRAMEAPSFGALAVVQSNDIRLPRDSAMRRLGPDRSIVAITRTARHFPTRGRAAVEEDVMLLRRLADALCRIPVTGSLPRAPLPTPGRAVLTLVGRFAVLFAIVVTAIVLFISAVMWFAGGY